MKAKPFTIDKWKVRRAFELVKANKGAAGVDDQSLADYETNLKDNLYKLWNRMSSGSYFPSPVKAVAIPKKSGGERILGIPTVEDRIAQMVVKLEFEPQVEPYFLPHSYGYRPSRSALDAIGVTRRRCWEYDWVLEFDIKGLFDNISHHLLMTAVRKHTSNPWVILYIERWLTAPLQQADGELTERIKGTPQGGVISPVLSNLFLHYVFDKWMQKHHPNIPWCRYADDGLAHCKSEAQAKTLLELLEKRFRQCGLELHPQKTKIVYCKDGQRKGVYENTTFDFLGYTFRRRLCKNRKHNSLFVSFTPAVSKVNQKAMRRKIRKMCIRMRTDLNIAQLAGWLNPMLSGWLAYYGRYYRSALYSVFRHLNKALVRWARRKFKPLRHRKTRAMKFLEEISKRCPRLFAHWRAGMVGGFA
ncbi:group II intron reverse transcriptase/maturase [Endozoicomonas ascidiicola]|uniref:group II intron reverse transcriptase/maturase n=1 Tax=Endozoicomonas ascidiicola TaxID=1698521 RepID=UPI0008356716|nr:group II intron reverse transcriptase/maturase [Endozoicomonas ascidiicola]